MSCVLRLTWKVSTIFHAHFGQCENKENNRKVTAFSVSWCYFWVERKHRELCIQRLIPVVCCIDRIWLLLMLLVHLKCWTPLISMLWCRKITWSQTVSSLIIIIYYRNEGRSERESERDQRNVWTNCPTTMKEIAWLRAKYWHRFECKFIICLH